MRILWISDFDHVGSGYSGISINTCTRLAFNGHDVKAVGFVTRNLENNFPFTFIPVYTLDVNLFLKAIKLLNQVWKFDVLIVALDLPWQDIILRNTQEFRKDFKYLGIFPIESDPLARRSAITMLMMDKGLVISKFGKKVIDDADFSGNVEYLPIGMDNSIWNSSIDPVQRSEFRRKVFGVDSDDVPIILTIADNQERKNLASGIEALGIMAKKYDIDFRYVLVTREHLFVGWDLRELFDRNKIHGKAMIFERGIDVETLADFYRASDIFFLPSKAEGLGMPVLEAMACGIPVVGTGCTSIKTLLEEFGGFPVPYDYVLTDPFANGNRYFIDRDAAADILFSTWEKKRKGDLDEMLRECEKQVMIHHDWEDTIDVIEKSLEELK